MVTCLKFDNVNNKLWYGTAESSVKCLDLTNVETKENGYTIHQKNETLATPSMEVKGKLSILLTI